ncbi:MAG: gamma-glutamylcyclotransferase [Blastochloris sp.]|nr:gamma-glutamylcyclotransferase [Blastochloris sp.]
MAITYFAYGSNMSPRIIENVCPSYKFIARACLIDYRLAFTRRSVRWEAGVANIISAPGMTVWGILFEIDDADLVSLDDKEAYGKAYDRITVQVDMKDYSESGTQKINAITYQVISPEQFEIRPHPDYLKMLIDGAGQFKLPLNYISFLKSLENEPMSAFRKGMLVFPSQDRQDARGSNIVVVDKKVAQEKELKDFVMVSYGHKFCLAKVSFLDSSKRRNDSENVCEMDQSIRQALGMPGRECYGANVSLHPANKGTPNYWIFQPRSLILQTYRSSTFDSEKNICVLHPHNIRLLGIEEGEYVKVLHLLERMAINTKFSLTAFVFLVVLQMRLLVMA